MYALLLIACIAALTLSPLVLDAILVWKETRPQRRYRAAARESVGLAPVTPRLH